MQPASQSSPDHEPARPPGAAGTPATGVTGVSTTAAGVGCVVGVLAFLAELVLFAEIGMVGWRLGGGGLIGGLVAALLLAAGAALWAFVFAPRARFRLRTPVRAALIGLLAAVVAAALFVVASPGWAWLAVGVAVVLVVTQLVMGENAHTPPN